MPAVHELLTNDDLWSWERMTAAIAATAPWWEPGTRHSYHTNTFGHLVGEIARRVDGVMPHDALRAVAGPLGADVWFGVPAAEQGRCAELLWNQDIPPIDFDVLEGDVKMTMMSYFNPPGYCSAGVVNTARWRSAQVPATNGHGTATGVARIYAALLEPGRLLSSELLAEATRPQSTGFCPTLGEEVTFGLGFKPTTTRRPFGPNPHALRPLRHRRVARLRRPRHRDRVRLRDEPRDPAVAEHPQPRPHRRGLRLPLEIWLIPGVRTPGIAHKRSGG